MEIKFFEVRDRMTMVPVICVKFTSTNAAERYLLAMTGYGRTADRQSEFILMGKLQYPHLECGPEDHDGYPTVRTLPTAHDYVLKHWDQLNSGDVIDIEFITGETTVPKTAQRLDLA